MWVRVSQGFMMGLQVKKVAPHYPEAARRAGIQGSVLVQAHIDTNGDVVNLRVVSGDPALAPAATSSSRKRAPGR